VPASPLAAAVLDHVMGTANEGTLYTDASRSEMRFVTNVNSSRCVLLAVAALCSMARPNVWDGDSL